MSKKIIAIVLAASMLMLFGVPAFAANTQPEQYRIATTDVNVRSGPNSTRYSVIGYLVKGELVKYLGKSGAWSQISYKNTVGYVFSEYLTDPVNQAVKLYRYASEPVNVRSGPNSTEYPVIGVLKEREKVQYLGDVGDWALVYYKGNIGFVHSKYLSAANSEKVEYLGLSGGWSQILYKGKPGYVFSKYLTK